MQTNEKIVSFKNKNKTFVLKIQNFLRNYPIMIPVVVLLVSFLAFSILVGDRFFSVFNLSLIMQQVSIIGILAAAQSLIILTAGIDLSVAAIMALVAVSMGELATYFHLTAFLAIPIGLIAGVLAGYMNGWIIAKIKLPPFIVTLGTWNIFFALALRFSGAESIGGLTISKHAPLLLYFGNSISIGGAQITYGSILTILIFAVLWYILNKTAFGRHIYAVGDDIEAAELAGIRTEKVLLHVYMLAGFVCAIAAWASIGRIGAISPQSFYNANLQSITAVVIGGISLFGGRGSIMGALFGALIVGVFQAGLRMSGVDVLWQVFAIGWLIILAVGIDQWIRRITK